MEMRPLRLDPAAPVTGGISFDVEDWQALAARRIDGRERPPTDGVVRQMARVRRLLRQHEVRATCFVLGTVAEAFPDLVRELHEEGHEIATHGYRHVPLHRLTRSQVLDDLARSRVVLEEAIGAPIAGHRAPEFSIRWDNLEALDAVAEAGFSYDSSIFPIRHRRYGVPSFPRGPTQLILDSGRRIVEFPLATHPWMGTRVPVAGGGYFRVLPLGLLRHAIDHGVQDGAVPVLYFHPYEFDAQALRLPRAGTGRKAPAQRLWRRMQNVGRARVPGRVEEILARHRLGPLGELAQWLGPHEAQQESHVIHMPEGV